MILSHTNLANHYKVTHTFAAKQIYSLSEIETMLPFEMEARIIVYIMELEEEAQRLAQAKQNG